MTSRPMSRSSVLLLIALVSTCWVGPAVAKDESIISPVLHVDKDKGYVIVSSDSGVVTLAASKEAKPHLHKLPTSGMVTFVVEVRPGKPPLLKAWKVARGESSCKYFNGSTCK